MNNIVVDTTVDAYLKSCIQVASTLKARIFHGLEPQWMHGCSGYSPSHGKKYKVG